MILAATSIRFGFFSIVLLVGMVQGFVVGTSLLFSRHNQQANKFLAGLILILSLKLVPYVIGYAGFYGVYPWLDLAPFNFSLGIGPLLFLYVARLTQPQMPRAWGAHLVPVAIQAGTYIVLFLQPLSFKQHFEDTTGPIFNQIETVLTVVSLVTYLILTWRAYRGYEYWLRNAFGDPDSQRLKYLNATLLIVSTVLLAFVSASVYGLTVKELSYLQMFPFYLLLTVAVYVFGLRAFQYAQAPYPTTVEPPNLSESTDWAATAQAFTDQLQDLDFWRDSSLSIAGAARVLGTSESRLSKAINAGLGITFSEWINRHRISEVTKHFQDPAETRSILEIAFECGFNSKASFNRWFREIEGCTPTDYRQRFPKT